LTQKQVVNAKPRPGRKKDLLADGGSLHLECTVADDGVTVHRSWIFRYTTHGKTHDVGLGPTYTVGLREARDKARALRAQRLDGIDPLKAKRAAERERLAARAEREKAVTFKECGAMYLRAHSDKWRNARHREQWAGTLATYCYPALGHLAVADINTGHVHKTLVHIWTRIPETARRVQGRIKAVLDFATAAGYRVGDNPASWDVLKHLLAVKKEVRHHSAVPVIEVPAFFAKLRQNESMAGRALQFLIVTATRTGEVLGAKWDEIDLQAKVWTVPAARMKSGREHRVPLNDGAVALLQALPHHDGYVFHRPGHYDKSLNEKSMLGLLYEMRPGATVHGFRSTFSDWAHEQTAHSNYAIEISLAHAVGTSVERSYRRGDLFEKRRRLMQEWDRFLAAPLPAERADILHLTTATGRK
jgi:integrase